MDKYEKRIKEMLHAAGAILVRDGRHFNYKVGKHDLFVQPKTPSDWRSSRNAEATLRRILERVQIPEVPSNLTAEPLFNVLKKPRMRIPNNPPRERGELVIPPLSGITGHVPTVVGERPFSTIIEVLSVVDRSDMFWDLDPCGRIRVLETITNRFAKVEIVPALFCRASIQEVLNHFGCPEGEDAITKTFPGQEILYMRTIRDWGLNGIPSMLVHDPVVGEIIVEASAWSLLEETNYLSITTPSDDGEATEIASAVWSGGHQGEEGEYPPDHFIYSVFVPPKMMKRKGFKLHTCGNWTDPAKTRVAVRQVLEIAQSDLRD
jgi:hypothetical protein